MEIRYTAAGPEDTDELIRLRLEYITEDSGCITDDIKEAVSRQLKDYFARKLGSELIVFTAKDRGRIIAAAFLHIIEMPANARLPGGLYGEVLNVLTKPEYRGKGIGSKLIGNLIEYAENAGLGCIDLKATDAGYRIYEKAGFREVNEKYRSMRYLPAQNGRSSGRGESED